MADPCRVEFVLDLEQPQVVIRTILRTSKEQRLVRAEVRRIVIVFDIHLRSLQEESVDIRGIFVLIPVDKELGVTLVTVFEVLEPAWIAEVREERRRIFGSLEGCERFTVLYGLVERFDNEFYGYVRTRSSATCPQSLRS